MKTIQILCLLAFLAMFSCKNQSSTAQAKAEVKEEVATTVETKVKPVAGCNVIQTGELPESNSLMAFKAGIENDCLKLSVTYSGGCEKHDIQLYWDGAWAESIPPQTHLYLYHDNKGDHCRELKMEKIPFDLQKMRYEGLNIVQFTIHSGELEPVSLRYSYK